MLKTIPKLFLFSSLILIGTVVVTLPYANGEDDLVSIKNNSGFSHFKDVLKQIIKDRTPSLKGQHHFHVARYSRKENLTYMLWKEGRKLWILTPGDKRAETWLSVRYPASGQLIDLDKGVVKSDKEVGSSTYLVTRQWASEKVYDAVVNGDLVIINN